MDLEQLDFGDIATVVFWVNGSYVKNKNKYLDIWNYLVEYVLVDTKVNIYWPEM